MRSTWLTALAGVVAVVAVASLAIGFASPDGSVGGSASVRPTGVPTAAGPSTTTASPRPSARTPSAARAPAAVRGTWPGRPTAVAVDGTDVDWCPAVRLDDTGEARREFGEAATRRAACAAVRFVFGTRYSRLALPRASYAADDFAFVLPSLATATARDVYRPRIDAFVAAPGATTGEALGLVLLRGAAGRGRIFYGPASTGRGYRDRAVWVNPRWSTVTVRVDRAKVEPRIVASLTASASVPVFDTSARRDDMMTIPTTASYVLRRVGSSWRIGGWTVTTGAATYAPLAVRSSR